MDVHGDEAIPHNFIAGFEGIPAATPRQLGLYARYCDTLARITPEFQTRVGYGVSKPGTGNMTMATNAIAHRFGCPAFTLEMPFKDATELPDPLPWLVRRALDGAWAGLSGGAAGDGGRTRLAGLRVFPMRYWRLDRPRRGL